MTQPLVIDDKGNTAFVLLTSENKIDFTLIRPDGQVITPGLSLNTSTPITFAKLPESAEFPAKASYIISETMPGTWQLQIKNLSPQTDTVRYVAYALLDSQRQLIVGDPKTSYSVGATVVFTAALRNAAGSGIAGAQLTAQISRPDGIVDTLNFSDRGDGNYLAAYVVPNAPGYVMMAIDASGTDNGVAFTRHADKLWTINPYSAKFTGKVSDQTVDQDKDGLFEKLAVQVEINVTQPSTYTVIAHLMANGTVIDSSSSALKALPIGVHTIELLFDGYDIRALSKNMELVIGNGQILDVTHGDIPVADEPMLHTTKLYRPADFMFNVSAKIYLPVIVR